MRSEWGLPCSSEAESSGRTDDDAAGVPARPPSPARSELEALAPELVQHPVTEQFVLLAQPYDLRRPGYHRAARDDLLRPELLPREVDLHARAQPVPPVEVRALAVDPHLAADQLAA